MTRLASTIRRFDPVQLASASRAGSSLASSSFFWLARVDNFCSSLAEAFERPRGLQIGSLMSYDENMSMDSDDKGDDKQDENDEEYETEDDESDEDYEADLNEEEITQIALAAEDAEQFLRPSPRDTSAKRNENRRPSLQKFLKQDPPAKTPQEEAADTALCQHLARSGIESSSQRRGRARQRGSLVKHQQPPMLRGNRQ